MRHGFVKVAAATPDIRVADVAYNQEQICRLIDETASEGAKIVVFPELALTGYTCGDLFTQDVLLAQARKAICQVAAATEEKDALIFVGMPLAVEGELYNVAAALNRGKILGFTTKTFLPNYGEFYEMRQFREGPEEVRCICFEGEKILFGPRILFEADVMPDLIVSAEICEDVWSPVPPSIQAAREGATVIVNCSASDETIGKAAYRKSLIEGQSARLMAAYIYANAGEGESTTDLVFGGHNIISENGTTLAEGERFKNGVVYAQIDVKRLISERRKNTTFKAARERHLARVPFRLELTETKLTRKFPSRPFVPDAKEERDRRCEEILTIQAMGLKKRLAHTHARSAVVGISGGLDSTLAILVTARAFDMLGMDRSQIIAVTMPCFGTTDRTYNNACQMALKLGAQLREVRIADSVESHFRDIGHDIEDHSVTYENSQARERTQVLMDISNHRRTCGRYRGHVGAGSRVGHLQRGSHVHVRGQRLRAQDACAPSGAVLCGHRKGPGDERRALRCAGHTGEPGAPSAEGRPDRPEDGGSGGTLRAPRLLSVLFPPLWLRAFQDLPDRQGGFCGRV